MRRAGALALAVVLAACAASERGAGRGTTASNATPHEACRVIPVTSCDVDPPTYEHDVRAVLERRCFACHAGEGPAAEDHDWASYAVAFAQRRSIADQLAACAMPPPTAPRPSTEEAELLLRWIACGAREH